MEEMEEPTILGFATVGNAGAPELKGIVRCGNPATGERLNVCYLVDGGRRVLSLATTAVPRKARPSASCSLWLDVDSGEWGASEPTCGEDASRIRDALPGAAEAKKIAEACGPAAAARAVMEVPAISDQQLNDWPVRSL